ncbi:MAG: hypothetical protein GPOALKHO_001948 [Sodalis sp.]|nr:MAG: hypothetical protein GPOALKHO_001948 [Sodalis sp.]
MSLELDSSSVIALALPSGFVSFHRAERPSLWAEPALACPAR